MGVCSCFGDSEHIGRACFVLCGDETDKFIYPPAGKVMKRIFACFAAILFASDSPYKIRNFLFVAGLVALWGDFLHPTMLIIIDIMAIVATTPMITNRILNAPKRCPAALTIVIIRCFFNNLRIACMVGRIYVIGC